MSRFCMQAQCNANETRRATRSGLSSSPANVVAPRFHACYALGMQGAVAQPGLSIFLRQAARLTRANLKSRYRKTVAGFFWVILNPLIMFGVQSLIFSRILNINVPNYYLFLVSGLIPWLFIVQSLEMCTPLFQYSGSLLKAFPVHPLVYLVAQLTDNFTNFLVAFTLILAPLVYFDQGPLARFLLLPLPMLSLTAGVLAGAWLLATLQVFLRDTRYLTTFALNVSFFLTPVFFSVDLVPEELRWFVHVNPFYILIAPFQALIHKADLALFWAKWLQAVALAAVALILASLFWRAKRNAIYFHV
ncbi:MAG TPA: ABC transporter permease [Bdellovibrionales bacterium]|nr:ABC transporter permease [Bdellovibrionales bacterium]